MTHRAAAIGVFDSGVGGLSILRAIRTAMTHEHLIYVADSGHAPYGDRDEDFVVARSCAIARFLLAQQVKAIVVACNTATVGAVTAVRAMSDVPVIGIEPAIKPAASRSRTGVIGVLATQRTARSASVERLIEQHAQGRRVLVQACSGWVEQVERGELASEATRALLARTLAPLLDAGVDTLVLGCTHYVFLAPLLQGIAGPAVALIEPSDAVVRELARRLAGSPAAALRGPGTVRFFASGSLPRVRSTIAALWGTSIEVEALSEEPRAVPAFAGSATA